MNCRTTIPISSPATGCMPATDGRTGCRAGGTTLLDYYARMERLTDVLLRAFALALDLDEAWFLGVLPETADADQSDPLSAASAGHLRPAVRSASALRYHRLHDPGTGRCRRTAGRARRRLDRRAADRRQLRDQHRRHDGALDQRPLRLHAASRDQPLRRRALFGRLLRHSRLRCRGRLPAELHGAGQSAEIPPAARRRVHAAQQCDGLEQGSGDG